MLVYKYGIRINRIGVMMKPMDFRKWCAGVKDLTPHQRQVLADRLHPVGLEPETCVQLESRVTEKRACPHCGHDKIFRWGFAHGLQRYRCAGCRKTFNALSGTPLARLRYKDKWGDYATQLTEGRSVRTAAAVLSVSHNTTFRWRHRFLSLPKRQQAALLSGIAEVDETYFLESHKGQRRDLNRPPRKRGGKASQRGTSKEQIPVLICRDRTGSEADFVLEKDDQAHVSAVLKPLLAPDVVLCTDSSRTLAAVAREIGVTHRAINLAAGQRVIAGVYHVQNVNAYDSRLKEWMRRFHGVATKYLPSYLGWRRFLESHTNDPSPTSVLRAALGMDRVQHVMGT